MWSNTKFKNCFHFCLNAITIISFLFYSLHPISNIKAKALSPDQIESILTTPKSKFKVHSYRFKKVSLEPISFQFVEDEEDYYYASAIIEAGQIGNMGGYPAVWNNVSYSLGEQDGSSAKVINASHTGHACLTVSMGSIYHL